MRRTNRNRSDYRSTALCLIIGLVLLSVFILPAAGDNTASNSSAQAPSLPQITKNTAMMYLSPDGKTLTVNATLYQQSTYTLVKAGFLDDEPLTPKTFTLTDVNGSAVAYKVSKSTVSFPTGNYFLNYTQDVSDNKIYAKFPVEYAVKVYLTSKFETGHLVLGTINNGGVKGPSDKAGYKTVVTYDKTKTVEVKFFEKGRDLWLYGFLIVWGIVLAIVFARYQSIRKRRKNAAKFDE